MASFSRLHKIALISLGAVGGSLAYYTIGKSEKKFDVHNSWTVNYTPSVKWEKNWDCREPQSIVKPVSPSKPEDENRYNEQIEKAKSKAVRHLFLIRHGQYHTEGATDKERILTDLGRIQADLTGKRLACLDIKWDLLVRSTMTRAQETASIIAKHLPQDLEVKDCQLIEEGAPIPPEPPVGHWAPEPKQFFQDGARIEAAFRRYFYRAPPEQTKDTYTLLVCHANVIRFFVCKALQFPPEGWLRISLNHGSITWVSILPNGNVVLRSLSDTGHMEPKYITSRWLYNPQREYEGTDRHVNKKVCLSAALSLLSSSVIPSKCLTIRRAPPYLPQMRALSLLNAPPPPPHRHYNHHQVTETTTDSYEEKQVE